MEYFLIFLGVKHYTENHMLRFWLEFELLSTDLWHTCTLLERRICAKETHFTLAQHGRAGLSDLFSLSVPTPLSALVLGPRDFALEPHTIPG